MRIASFPPQSVNPYIRRFYGELAATGVSLHPRPWFSVRWLWKERDRVDAVHFHWPEQLWSGFREHPARGLLKLASFLSLARVLGIRIFWTAHNVDPHERSPWADAVGLRLIASLADLVICHSASAREVLAERYGIERKVVLMPHGNYDGVYPAPRPAAEVKAAWGLALDRPVLACIGRLRDYKGLDVACEAASRLGDQVQLLVAGVPHPGFDLDSLSSDMARLPEAILVPRSLSDAEFADLVSASDIVLLPYRHVTGSGALLAAWSLGRAIVASDLPYFRELTQEGSPAGRLFRVGDPESCAEAVREVLQYDAEGRSQAARAMAESFAWERCVVPVAHAIAALSPASPSESQAA